MASIHITQISAKGQVQIPEDIRSKLGLHPGDKFIVIAGRGYLTLKTIVEPSSDEFGLMMAKAKKQALKAGLKKADVKTAIVRTRGHK